MLQVEGLEVSAAGLVRSNYFPGAEPPCPVTVLGRVEHGRYARRALSVPSVVRGIRALPRPDVIHCFDSDMAIYAMLAGTGAKIVVEVADIQPILTGRGWKSALARQIDGTVVSRADLVVVTAEGYLSGYYASQGITPRRSLVIENRIDGLSWDAHQGEWEGVRNVLALPFTESGVMSIGYFGLLRCSHTWAALRGWAAADPDRRRLLVRGYPGVGGPPEEELRSSPGVEYGGPFEWPDELAHLYGDVDLVCAAYPVGRQPVGNWRWARTNRFYEACMFRRPLLVLSGSADAEPVARYDIGTSLEFGDRDTVLRQLDHLSPDRVLEWHRNFRSLPDDVFLEAGDGPALRAALEAIA